MGSGKGKTRRAQATLTRTDADTGARARARTRTFATLRSAIIAPSDAALEDTIGRKFSRSRSTVALTALAEAAQENQRLGRFMDVIDARGPDTITLAQEKYEDFLAIHVDGQTIFFVDELKDFLSCEREPLFPGVLHANASGLPATLRHEYAHGIWDSLSDREWDLFANNVPEDAEKISSGLTQYAGYHFKQWWKDPQILSYNTGRKPEVQTYPVVETWTELFAVSTDSTFDEKQWPRWVRRALKTQRKIIGDRWPVRKLRP